MIQEELHEFLPCMMYDAGKGTSIVVARSQLDTLTPASIWFCPYDEHREERPFE